jgi:hypothetical protein
VALKTVSTAGGALAIAPITTTFSTAGSATWTKNPNAKTVQVLVVGGGGGGGFGGTYTAVGGGSGGGVLASGFCIIMPIPSTSTTMQHIPNARV